MRRLHVLAVASEIFPLVKTGGLADVVGALPPALARENIATRTLVPGYPAVREKLTDVAVAHSFSQLHGGAAQLLIGKASGLDLFVLEAPHLYARPGNPYVGPDGHEWPDNGVRFAALASAAAAIARGAVGGYAPDIVHCHDWQAGLVPALLHYRGSPRPATVMTVHNLSFQGQFPRELLARIGLPPHAYTIDGVEYHGTIGYLKAGLALSDRITTVSPTYAVEIRTPEDGMGLDGLLRKRAGVLTGILNGIDDAVWNPATDASLPARFDEKRLSRRATNRTALQARFGLDRHADALLLGVVSRLTFQKGMDLLLDSLPAITAAGAQLALIGSGDKALEIVSLPQRHAIRSAWPRSSGTTSPWRISCRQAPMRCWCHPASSRVASRSSARCATARFRSWRALADWPTPSSTRTRWRSRQTRERASSSHRSRGAIWSSPWDEPSRSSTTARPGGACSYAPWRPTSGGLGRAKRYAALYRDLVALRPA
jgi:ADP-glucose type glycogen/starch synthase